MVASFWLQSNVLFVVFNSSPNIWLDAKHQNYLILLNTTDHRFKFSNSKHFFYNIYTNVSLIINGIYITNSIQILLFLFHFCWYIINRRNTFNHFSRYYWMSLHYTEYSSPKVHRRLKWWHPFDCKVMLCLLFLIPAQIFGWMKSH